VCRADQKLWVQNNISAVFNFVYRHRVHVVDDQPVMNFESSDTEIASSVSDNDVVA